MNADTTYVYFDIETIPNQTPEYLERLMVNVTAPASYKKPESIKDWLTLNRIPAAHEALAKTSFDGGRGHVCTISWAKDNHFVTTHHAKTVEHEAAIIQEFFDALDPYHSETLVGHYISGFDIPFLKKRAICLGVKLPPNVSFPRDPKPWGDNIHDTMTMWAGSRGTVSLDELCDIFGIPGKDGFDGSMVADAWANGEHQKIVDYCADDVRRTREVHKRFLAAGW